MDARTPDQILDSLLADVDRVLAEQEPVPVVAPTVVQSIDGLVVVHKYASYVPVSCCVLTDSTGVNHCQHEPVVWSWPWHRRARWWLSGRWQRARYRVGRWVAGDTLDMYEED